MHIRVLRILVIASVLPVAAGCLDDKNLADKTQQNIAFDTTAPPEAIAGTAYSFQPVVTDTADESFSFEIQNPPTWADFDPSTGLLKGTPSDADVGETAEITITAKSTRRSGSVGPFRIRVRPRRNSTSPVPVDQPPVIGGTPPTSVNAESVYSFQPTAVDPEGATLTFAIVNRPSWARFDTRSGRLSGTPATSDAGNFRDVTISVSDGSQSAAMPAFSIDVIAPQTPANTPPEIGGDPPATVTAGQNYSFTPSARDADGDALSFSIDNKPAWASFDARSGTLSGSPAGADVGTYSSIRVTASDGIASTAMPLFSITVQSAPVTSPTPPAPGNSPPHITGTPASSVAAGNAYGFQPSAQDPDGDRLTFTIANKPAWATFDTNTGRLSGTPGATDVGDYRNITISVSDGQVSASLLPFTLSVTGATVGSARLSWVAPTTNTDGSSLDNLAGFRIYYGNASGQLTQSIDIADTSARSFTVNNLGSGSWYFSVAAYATTGAEGVRSSIVSKTIN
ncbi:MAG: putative Ig domain-containing protein [Steroidobacteraceae bacterium]